MKDSYANSFIPYLTANYAKIGVVDFRNFAKHGLDSTIEKKRATMRYFVLYNFQTFIADTNLIYILPGPPPCQLRLDPAFAESGAFFYSP